MYQEFDDDDYNNLGYYDSDDFDDSLYYNDVTHIIEIPIIQNEYIPTYLPNDSLHDILKYADMDTFIKMCSSSKNMRRLCTNQLWQYKFNQHDIPIHNQPIFFNDWVKLYYQHLHHSKIEEKVDHYLLMIRNHNESFFLEQLKRSAFFTIHLQKKLTNQQLIYFLRTITKNDDNFDLNRHNDFIIDVYYDKLRDYGFKYNVRISRGIILTTQEFKELLYQLFLNHYLHEKWIKID